MKIVRGFCGLTIQTLVIVLIVCAFVFAGGCFEDVFGKTNDTGKTVTIDKYKTNDTGKTVTTDKKDANYAGPYCTPPMCDTPDTCPPDCYPYKCPSNNCPGGCGMSCIKTIATPPLNWKEPTIPLKFQNLNIGDEAIISLRGSKIAVTVNSFKEYKPNTKSVRPEWCNQATWYKLQLKVKNVGEDVIIYPYTIGHLTDLKGDYISGSYCREIYGEENSSDIYPLPPGETRYFDITYVFSDNQTLLDADKGFFQSYTKIQNGAVFIYTTEVCPVEKSGCRPYPNVYVDQASWIVFP